MATVNPLCVNCALFSQGKCYLNPPIPIVVKTSQTSSLTGTTKVQIEEVSWQFPEVKGTDFCNYFKAK